MGEEDMEEGVLPGKKEKPPPASNSDIATAGLPTLLRKFPHLLIAPVISFCLIVALCSFGIVHATNASYDLEGKQARDAALGAADGLAQELSSASKAALSLAAVVKMSPNWSFLEANFHVLAEELFRQSNGKENGDGGLALMELTLVPFGRVRASLGKPNQRNSTADLFSPPFLDLFKTMEVLEHHSGLHIQGPFPLTNSKDLAFTAGYPIFFPDTDEDESWGHPDNITHPTSCPGAPCYNPETREKYWGSAGALVNAGSILAGKSVHLERLISDDLSYKLELTRPDGTTGDSTFVTGGSNPDKVTTKVTVALPGNSWALSVYNPRQEQVIKLRNGLLAMVVVVAFILSGLLLLLLLSSTRANFLLQEQLVTNKLLQEEKESREALLGRQFDLIACFEQNSKRKSQDRSNLSEGQLNTLEQIASAKAAISDVGSRKEEDIEVQELLAEGSFGKVYKGKWRCTDVAVKIIMLPGNMSGREKREKMIVWEAAISSSLVHPNVCQTYHYRIKPVKENARTISDMTSNSCVIVCSDQSCSKQKSGNHSVGASRISVPEEVHSYEVQLILEYCDRASLRDALDAGLFMTPMGMNYAAQLDCAMDVAKAMLHLHCNNVLHLDLKTRNVLLASSGSEGKGVTCKVSDFGLSVRMDFSETHVSSLFQGTMTHMAPEVMLKGTCSKASDVYAFGIVLWELYTGGSPFRDVPPVLLGHSIVKDGKRPTWPTVVPKGYKDLANACWDQNPETRPTFEAILKELQKLRKELGVPTAPLKPYPAKPPQSQLPHLQETFSSISQPSLLQLSRDSKDFLQAKGPSTPSQAALVGQAQQQPQGNGDTLKAEVPSVSQSQAARLETAWRQPRRTASTLDAKGPSTTHSQASRLEEAQQQPPGNGGTLKAEVPSVSQSQAARLEAAWRQPRRTASTLDAKGPSTTHSQASRLEGAWQQPSGNGGTLKAEVPSVSQSQAARLEAAWRQPRKNGGALPSKGPPAQPQAAHLLSICSSAPSAALSDTSMAAHGLPQQEGTLSASLAREEEEKTGSTNFVHSKAGQEGLNHPQCGTWERGHECSCDSKAPTPPPPVSLETSALPTTPGQLSFGPGAHSATPVHDPHARVVVDASSNDQCASFPVARTEPSHITHSVDGGDTREAQLVCGAEGGPESPMSDHEVTAGLWCKMGLSRADEQL